MVTVALVGPDGAGKTTVSRLLADELRLPVKQIYMGVNFESATLVLPTTRVLLRMRDARAGEPRAAEGSTATRRGLLRRGASSARAGARLAVWLSEEWFRQIVAWYYTRLRGHVVVFDRHFYADFHDPEAHSSRVQPLSGRIHIYLLEHVYPKPDLVIYLDAPAEVLFERKPEAPVEWLRGRREAYLSLEGRVPRFVAIDATRPAADVAREVADRILRLKDERGGTPRIDKGSGTA